MLTAERQIILTEPLRALPNLLAYSIDFFHFHPKNTGINTMEQAGFRILEEIKVTPFITRFMLSKKCIISLEAWAFAHTAGHYSYYSPPLFQMGR